LIFNFNGFENEFQPTSFQEAEEKKKLQEERELLKKQLEEEKQRLQAFQTEKEKVYNNHNLVFPP